MILITNDDGVYLTGLIALAEVVQHLGDLFITAPIFQQINTTYSFSITNCNCDKITF